MLGNVWEGCQDSFDASYYGTGSTTGPQGPSTGAARVIRGGAWSSDAKDVRLSNRVRYRVEDLGSPLGFRCVRVAYR